MKDYRQHSGHTPNPHQGSGFDPFGATNAPVQNSSEPPQANVPPQESPVPEVQVQPAPVQTAAHVPEPQAQQRQPVQQPQPQYYEQGQVPEGAIPYDPAKHAALSQTAQPTTQPAPAQQEPQLVQQPAVADAQTTPLAQTIDQFPQQLQASYATPATAQAQAQPQPIQPVQAATDTPDPKAKKKKRRIALIAGLLAFAMLVLPAGIALTTLNVFDFDRASLSLPTIQNDADDARDAIDSTRSTVIEIPSDVTNPSEDELSVQVARKVLPSVVSISGSMEMGLGMRSPEGMSAGAGVILSSEGYIVTNNHVIENLSNITVTAGAQTYPAVLVGADPSTDLAVLKIDATGDLPAIELGTSSNLLEGQYVMAVGSPFGHEQSVSSGIISGLGRSNIISTQTAHIAYVDLIQTDAAINPGNSGGALVDKAGRLIGINSLINTLSGASAGVGFAIPVDTVIHVSNQLIESGHASHAFLGIGTTTITPEIARAYGFPVERGVVVNSVVGGSPADIAGLQTGDFIVRIGDRSISSSEDVFSAIRSNRVGDSVEVEIYRSGENEVLTATLASDDFMSRIQQESPQQGQQPPQHPPVPNP